MGKISKDFDLGSHVKAALDRVVSEHEAQDITTQQQLYVSWEQDRQDLIQRQVDKYQADIRLQEVAQKLETLKDQEQKLKFFEMPLNIRRKVAAGKRRIALDELFESEEYKHWAAKD